MQQQKTYKFVYNSIFQTIAQEPTKCQQKWTTLLEYSPQWDEVHHVPFKTTKDPNLQYFQYKFIHFLIPTNTFLCKIKKKNSDICFFCNEEHENILHLLWDCSKVKLFWNNIIIWLNSTFYNPVTLSCKDICFSLILGKALISFIIILAKKFIFNNKCKEVPLLSITAFKEFVYSYFKTEKAIAIRNGSLDDLNKKWVNMF